MLLIKWCDLIFSVSRSPAFRIDAFVFCPWELIEHCFDIVGGSACAWTQVGTSCSVRTLCIENQAVCCMGMKKTMGTQNININYFIYSVSVFHSWDLALFVKGSWWRKQRLKQNRRKLLSINFTWTRRGSGFLSEPVEQTGRVNLTEDTLNFKGFGSHLWCQQWNCSSACPC